MVQSLALTRYVDPIRGRDRGSGLSDDPFRTIAHGLTQIGAGDTLQLTPGTYSAEPFALRVPRRVRLLGDAAQAQKILIRGGGRHSSPAFGVQSVTLVLEDGAVLVGVTVTNPEANGTGVWIESTSPTIQSCRFQGCRREGIFALGTGQPLIANSVFEGNSASGVFLMRQAKGELRQNLCRNTGFGIAISDSAAPLVIGNRLIENRSGCVLSRAACPVLRNNQILSNRADGLTVLDQAKPDLGDDQSPGGNTFEASGRFDVQNTSASVITSAGNQLNPARVSGSVVFEAVQLPPPVRAIASPPSPTTETNEGPAPFPDILDSWARPFIAALVERGVIRGFPDGTFRPRDPLTRAQYAVLLTRAFDVPIRRAPQPFGDVGTGFWARDAIQQATRQGFITGFPDGTFRPNASLTRLQTLLALNSGLQLAGGTLDLLSLYRDRAEIPSWATAATAAVTQSRLVVNHPRPEFLEPLRSITRAEISVIVYQGLVLRNQVSPVASPFIVVPP
ncbi:MAG: DUF1565 domain-containing protein [Elainellaceae cyanobacterium]